MADRVTCCPHCSTSFRITDAQLKSAKGAVRCGSCLKVFKALDHLTDKAAAPTTSPSTTEPSARIEPSVETRQSENTKPSSQVTPPAKAEAKAVSTDEPAVTNSKRLDFDQSVIDDDDDLLISDDMAQIEDTQNITLGGAFSEDFALNSKPSGGSLFDREVESKPSELDTSDESWAVGLLEEAEKDDDTATAIKANATANTDDVHSEDTDDFDYSRKTTGSFSALDDSDIEAALGEPLSSRKEPIFQITDGPENDSYLEEPLNNDDLAEYATEEEELRTDPDALTDDQRSVSELLGAIQPAPVEMEWQERSPWPQRLLWSGLSLIALSTLILQIGTYKFDDYSRMEPYRGFYASLCPILGCQLPSLADPSRVKAYNLVIRSHPRTADALVVDAIILNNAPFAQPFPDITLTFNDINNNTVASRRFKPEEYLGGEMAGSSNMPQERPIHLSLELFDPGAEAVNYQLNIAGQ